MAMDDRPADRARRRSAGRIRMAVLLGLLVLAGCGGQHPSTSPGGAPGPPSAARRGNAGFRCEPG